MKLNYDRKSKDPTYFIQQGFRNGKKTTTKNIKRIGKHSELLEITDDPLAYAKEMVAKYNEEAKNNNKVTMEVTIDFAEKIKAQMTFLPLQQDSTLVISFFRRFITIYTSTPSSKRQQMIRNLSLMLIL